MALILQSFSANGPGEHHSGRYGRDDILGIERSGLY